jgi:hypothetical protein
MFFVSQQQTVVEAADRSREAEHATQEDGENAGAKRNTRSISEESVQQGSSGEEAGTSGDASTKEKARQRVFGQSAQGITSPGDLFISSGVGVGGSGGEETLQQTNILPVGVQQFLAQQIEAGKLMLHDVTTDATLLQHNLSATSTSLGVSPHKCTTPAVSPAKMAAAQAVVLSSLCSREVSSRDTKS